MELLKYIVLGILQGVTEPLPISSSGHIYILKAAFNTALFDDLNLEILLNFASFIAILVIFWKDVVKLIKGVFSYIRSKSSESFEEFSYFMKILISTIPVGLLGLFVKKSMEDILSKNIFLVGFGFLFTGLALILVYNSNGKKKDKDITFTDAIVIGIFQAISLIPGISRSGLTLVGSLLCGLDRKTALKYTFMLYFPVSLASMGLGIMDLGNSGIEFITVIYYIIGMIGAGIFTFLSYNWLTRLVEKGSLWKFSIYLFAVALVTIMFFI